jgi:ParB-like chromosome segregation protein Spo0J
MKQPPLQSLHPEGSLSHTKLLQYSKLSTQDLIDSLQPGQPGALKVRPDGTVIDGHHRLKILYDRGIDIDALPREILPTESPLA